MLFSGEMVRAILEGRKTQTRRVCRVQPVPVRDGFDLTPTLMAGCPYGRQGDALWVRESGSIATDKSAFMYADFGGALAPTATPGSESWAREWRACPSIHMPRWASRITLEITAVRAQRLQDITADDSKAEGVQLPSGAIDTSAAWVSAFSHLWDSINGQRPGMTWADNPWVWALTFEKVAARKVIGL